MRKSKAKHGGKRILNRAARFAVCFVLSLMMLPMMLPMRLLLPVMADDENVVNVDPVGHPENYAAVLYNNTNGLPTSEANALAETTEGFIWIGCYSGLVRYDGNTFERISSTSGIGSVVSLLTDSKDRLWIGTNESGIALMERGEFKFWDEDDGLGSDKISTIAEDNTGVIYVGTTSGITMITPEMTVESLDDPRVSETYIEHIVSGPDGLMYVTTNEDDFFTVKNGKVVDYLDHRKAYVNNITAIVPDPDNTDKLYIGTGDEDLFYGNPFTDSDNLTKIDISPLNSVINIKNIGGKIWICSRNGIGQIDNMKFHNLKELPMNNSVTDVMTDYEGNLWFSSARQGLMKVVPNRFSDLFSRFALEERVVNTTCELDEWLLIGTDTGLIVLEEDEQIESIPLESAKTASGTDLGESDLISLFDGVRIRSIIRDSKQRLWLSTWRGGGLYCYDHGNVTAYTPDDGMLSDHVRAVCETADGSILAANTGGVSVIKDGSVIKSYGEKDGIINPEILTVAASPDGDILAGSNGGGIYVINQEGTRTIGKKDGLSSGIVMRIKYDPERSLYWLVTSNSIAYMTQDYKVTTISNFPYSNNFDMYENKKGDMWVLSSDGIYTVPADELVANGDIHAVHYSLANGLPYTATSNSYSELTDGGNLYIAGSSGVAKVNIDESMENVAEIRQAVPFVEADGVLYYPNEDGSFRLPSSIKRLTIHGHVFNYSLTDPQITYRLIGFDSKPVTVNRKDFGPVTFTNLAGGTYRFEMDLRDAMGRGNKTLKVPIIKDKALYEETWFFVAIGILISAILYWIVRSYVRSKMRILEKKHHEEAERDRISHELQMASRIQTGSLPSSFPAFPERSEFDIYAVMKPAREVGGDFYDFYMIDDDHLCIVMADVSGKGIPGALFMMISKVVLKIFAQMDQSAAEILSKTNSLICSNNKLDMFVTVWLGILEISSGRLIAANAGHEYPVLKKADGQFELIKDKHGIVIGGIDTAQYKDYDLHLQPGDKLFLYTDGIPEATDAGNQMFGTDRMIDVLNANTEASPESLLMGVEKAVKEFVMSAEQFDDMTMLCLEYNGQETAEE